MAISVSLAREGAKVLVADVSEENATKTAQKIRDEKLGEAAVFVGDATKSEESAAMITAASDHFERLDVLVNNLGYGPDAVARSYLKSNSRRGMGVAEINDREWKDAFDINLNSAMLASRYAIPVMARSGGGSIINLSSCDAISSADHYGAPYSVSKSALHMLTRGTAAWHGREGIRANCIAPGHLYSAWQANLKPAHRERRKKVVPLGTEGTPWDVAMAAVFLASDESRWISGIVLPVDGGLYAAQPMLTHEFITGENFFRK